jgi:hypothetical protein
MRRVLPGVHALAGFGLLLAGVITFDVANQPPPDFGWSSYAPLEPVTGGAYDSLITYAYDDGWAVTWTRGHLVGAGLVVVGLLVLVGVGGWWLGRRAGRMRGAAT